jgi:endonuclease/exonuclease/phosphatase family metal-dependent hydrolase
MRFLSYYLKRILLLVVCAFLFHPFNGISQQEDEIKVMQYNILDYPVDSSGTVDTLTRNPYFRTIMGTANPDILVVEELNSAAGLAGFLSNVLNASSTTYAAGTFINGPDTDNGIYYKTSRFQFVSNTRIKAGVRDINEFKLVHLLSGDTVRIYAAHLKASSGAANEAERAQSADSLRKVTNALPAGSDFIICGDFNIYGSTEPAYQKLLDSTINNTGVFIDPITMTGTWNQNSASYRIHHTQSTRKTAFSYGGGSNGGLDDRFDLILYSKAISQSGGMTYVPNSEIAYGNDGNHYNDSIMRMPNTAVPAAVATALYYTSDHLPVIANFKFQYGSVSPPDAGVLSLLSPVSPVCANANQLLQVTVKNYGTNTINFSSTNLPVTLQVLNPASVQSTFSKTISTGSLSPNATMTVTFDSLYNMSNAGNYLFNASTTLAGDGNNTNNSMPQAAVTVNSNPAAFINPPGPLVICNGSPVTLTASNGAGFLWSNGITTQAAMVSNAGSYSVAVTYANGCTSTSSTVVITATTLLSGNVFLETMDSVHGTSAVPIATYEANNGFLNDDLTMSGSADVRNTTSSWTKYAGASGGANVFVTDSSGKNFIISGINTSDKLNLQLSFGINKSSTAGTGSDLLVKVSSDGINYTTLSYPALPTGNGTAIWHYRTATGTIPSVSNLRIQFRQNDTITQYRIDDVKLTYSGIVPVITANGPTTLCSGDSVTLTASNGTNYLWSSGETTQSIIVHNSGSYNVIVNCVSSSPIAVTVNNCTVNLNLKVFIEGYYLHGDSMISAADPIDHPFICDTITVQLVDSINLGTIAASATNTITTQGQGIFSFDASHLLPTHKYYIAIRHRNALETWSKYPLLFNTPTVTFDLTRP